MQNKGINASIIVILSRIIVAFFHLFPYAFTFLMPASILCMMPSARHEIVLHRHELLQLFFHFMPCYRHIASVTTNNRSTVKLNQIREEKAYGYD